MTYYIYGNYNLHSSLDGFLTGLTQYVSFVKTEFTFQFRWISNYEYNVSTSEPELIYILVQMDF